MFGFLGEYMDDGLDYSYSTINEEKTNQQFVYVLCNDKVLKLLINIDERIIEDNFSELIRNLNKKDFKFATLEEIKRNKLTYLLGLFQSEKLNKSLLNRYYPYKIPNKNKLNSTLIYILVNIYNNNDITSDILYDLNEEYNFRYNECNNIDKINRIWIEAIKNIVDNFKIKVVEEYDYNTFNQSINFIENITDKEKLNSIIELDELKNILLEAKENKPVFENLNIKINEEKQLRK